MLLVLKVIAGDCTDVHIPTDIVGEDTAVCAQCHERYDRAARQGDRSSTISSGGSSNCTFEFFEPDLPRSGPLKLHHKTLFESEADRIELPNRRGVPRSTVHEEKIPEPPVMEALIRARSPDHF